MTATLRLWLEAEQVAERLRSRWAALPIPKSAADREAWHDAWSLYVRAWQRALRRRAAHVLSSSRAAA